VHAARGLADLGTRGRSDRPAAFEPAAENTHPRDPINDNDGQSPVHENRAPFETKRAGLAQARMLQNLRLKRY